MTIWHEAIQGSADWLAARLGHLTASCMVDAMDFTGAGREGSKRLKLKIAILCERLTGISGDRYVSPAMRHGIEQEPFARQWYSDVTGVEVQTCGFATHSDIPMFGASPDGLIGETGCVEIKCPESATHLQWLLAGVVPEQHRPQMLAQILVTGRKWCHFVSYDPRFPEQHRMFLRNYVPTTEELAGAERAARKFLIEVDEMMARL
jgi:putative phage-type endonuclease